MRRSYFCRAMGPAKNRRSLTQINTAAHSPSAFSLEIHYFPVRSCGSFQNKEGWSHEGFHTSTEHLKEFRLRMQNDDVFQQRANVKCNPGPEQQDLQERAGGVSPEGR